MARLSREEQEQLDALLARRDAPDEPAGRQESRVHNVNVTIDLSDEKQVKRAMRLGLLNDADLEDAPPDDDEEPEPDETPGRKDRY